MAEEHQWVVVALYELSKEEVERQPQTKERVGLTGKNLIALEGPGCYRCEKPWAEAKGTPCSGGPRLERQSFLAEPVEGGTNVDRQPRG